MTVSGDARHAKNVHAPKAGMCHGIRQIGQTWEKHAKERPRPQARMCHGIREIAQKLGKKHAKKTSTTQSRNVAWNQGDKPKRGARPKAGMSFGISKKGATSNFGKMRFSALNMLKVSKSGMVVKGRKGETRSSKPEIRNSKSAKLGFEFRFSSFDFRNPQLRTSNCSTPNSELRTEEPRTEKLRMVLYTEKSGSVES